MNSQEFYQELSSLPGFLELLDSQQYNQVPEDWHVVVSDVKGSTENIQKGKYKDVNTIGASSIIAVLNAVKPLKIPFVFGGDGASLCVPQSCLNKVYPALQATRQLAQQAFGLDLRIGTVPVDKIHETPCRVKVAKVRISPHYEQAVFDGGGMKLAEDWVKHPDIGKVYRLPDSENDTGGDFSGLECRWQSIPSPHEETVALLVQAVSESEEQNHLTYKETLEKIFEIYGEESEHHPVRPELMNLTRSNKDLRNEFKVRTFGRSMWGAIRYWFDLWGQQILGYFLVNSHAQFAGVDWGRYKPDFVSNTDYKKFDDMLRYIISGDTAQRGELTRFLQAGYERGNLVYGMHASGAALVTCLIFNYNQDHIHFIDGANGGYAIAAKGLKEQLATLERKRSSE